MTPRLALLASSVAGDPRSAFMSRHQLMLYRGDPSSRALLLRGARGDPFLGFIGAALGGLAKKAIGGIKTLVTKKPAAPAFQTQLALPGGGAVQPYPSIYATPAAELAGRAIGGMVSPLTLPVAAAKYVAQKSGLSTLVTGGFPTAPTRGAAYTGTGYGVPGRRRRRMNPLNPRALRRALTRACRFEKFARQVVRITPRFKRRTRKSPIGRRR